MPLPDEMIVMSGGFLSSLGKLVIWKSFLLTYLGVVSGLSLGFILGKLFGHRVLDKLVKRKGKVLIQVKRIVRSIWTLRISPELLYSNCSTYPPLLGGNE